MSKVAILGAGAYGTALGGILAENGHDIDYYDPAHEEERLKDVLNGAKFVVLCTPSEVTPRLLPHLDKNTPLVVATKGFLTTKYFDDFKKWGVISGPSYAGDLKNREETIMTATSDWIIQLFITDFIKFDFIEDKKAVLMCGSLKNVYAILAGKFGLQSNTIAMKEFIESALFEISQILEANDADKKAAFSACGIGDLILTCRPESRNYTFGLNLRNRQPIDFNATLEGVTTLRRIAKKEIIVPESAQFLRQLILDSESWK